MTPTPIDQQNPPETVNNQVLTTNTVTKKSSKNLLLVFIIGCGCLFILSIVVVGAMIIIGLSYENRFNEQKRIQDQKVDEMLRQRSGGSGNVTPFISPYNQPTSKPKETNLYPLTLSNYQNIPDSVKNETVACGGKSFIPSQFQNNSYFCKNIYQVSSPAFLNEAIDSKAQRIVLNGQYIYFDCPIYLGNDPKLSISRCFNAAKFTDNNQIPKVLGYFGISGVKKKIYYYVTKDINETKSLCPTNASACADFTDNLIIESAQKGGGLYYADKPAQGSICQGANKEINYWFTFSSPPGCLGFDTHELIHIITHEKYMWGLPQWFSEGFTHFLEAKVFKAVCPPGTTLTNIVKEVNGKKENLSSFDITTLDDAEPMSCAVEGYTNGNTCEKAIFMEFARVMKQDGFTIIPKFFDTLKNESSTQPVSFARTLYVAEGSPESTKQYFRDHGCL